MRGLRCAGSDMRVSWVDVQLCQWNDLLGGLEHKPPPCGIIFKLARDCSSLLQSLAATQDSVLAHHVMLSSYSCGAHVWWRGDQGLLLRPPQTTVVSS
jgi:hypothetical protein